MMENELPDAPSCRRNQQPILQVIEPYLAGKTTLLEIGSGTGQHAVYLAGKMPHLIWQTSDLTDNHDAINAWRKHSQLSNVLPPLSIDVTQRPWCQTHFDAIFTANTLHIVSPRHVESFFAGCAEVINNGGLLLIYGPFKYGGQFTSASNAQFEQWLKARDPQSGIRDFEWINQLAKSNGFRLMADHPMPANNQLLAFEYSNLI